MQNNEETVQTVQEETNEPKSSKAAYFEVAKDDKDTWHWCLWSANGRMMATNAVPYDRRNDCTKAIAVMLEALKQQTKILVRSE